MSELGGAIEDIVEESGEDREAIEAELSDFFGVPVSVQRIQTEFQQNRVRVDVTPDDFTEKLQDQFSDVDVNTVSGNFNLYFGVDFDS